MSDLPDLVELAGGPMLTPAQRRAMQKRAHKPASKAYAAPPGSGPAGETCKTCKHIARTHTGAAKTYRKCDLMRDHWTHGPGSDIRAGSPACSRWEAGEKKGAAPILPPPTLMERDQARIAARALAEAMKNPSAIKVAGRMHIDYQRPRLSEWITTYVDLPGFSCVNGQFCHALLPGWVYTSPEVVSEMIPDLEALAERGERPTQATS